MLYLLIKFLVLLTRCDTALMLPLLHACCKLTVRPVYLHPSSACRHCCGKSPNFQRSAMARCCCNRLTTCSVCCAALILVHVGLQPVCIGRSFRKSTVAECLLCMLKATSVHSLPSCRRSTAALDRRFSQLQVVHSSLVTLRVSVHFSAFNV